ncbi:Cas10/Cmr2 second palm domain-containing protein [Crocosphaera sp. XPORK-15E]|uniref:Cas10/Cmr2 second palm domain-containing protein n=1 Tax=Crocosphaera sp. XPORK-15E TaxID=3110247 RepID=UPI002B219918|nr:type III-B CRISPR-associated protein Cas10/Cmr2 [Crocosphaera sp. XPORK-15E]MEA5537047.1 type III-B CRISPR-associated protein Cas10/Cmr2 [Crocosphaera sp. XPORK-15E]
MTNPCYTVVTFAPIQDFIEKSRKLRDLYGSSYILSFLSWGICQAANTEENCSVISPARINVTQGLPNLIIISGNFSQEKAKAAFSQGWELIVKSCYQWIINNVEGWEYQYWQRDWKLWTHYAWEFFWAQNETKTEELDPKQCLDEALDTLFKRKPNRQWTAINWQGESSTLSGSDSIAYPNLGKMGDTRNYSYEIEKETIRQFYEQLSQKLGESFVEAIPSLSQKLAQLGEEDKQAKIKEYGASFIDPREQLSIPELIKRLITHKVIVKDLIENLPEQLENSSKEDLLQIAEDLDPHSFSELNRHQEIFKTGWFLGDGDNVSNYLKNKEEQEKTEFSKLMREWGLNLQRNPQKYLPSGRIIYAGGDDFLGIIYDANSKQEHREPRQISGQEYLEFFSHFKTRVWNQNQYKPITPSVGFVWASSQVPQRDILQHCRETEQSAKKNGKDRLAIRLLFNNGNTLQWICPWWLLEEQLFQKYRDRDQGQNWNHFYRDVITLESRHAFTKQPMKLALALINIYFGTPIQELLENRNKWWNYQHQDDILPFSGIFGEQEKFLENNQTFNQQKFEQVFTQWVINLAKIGFYLNRKS